MHIVNKHKKNETMRITPSSGAAVYIDSSKMVTPPVTINQRKATAPVIIN